MYAKHQIMLVRLAPKHSWLLIVSIIFQSNCNFKIVKFNEVKVKGQTKMKGEVSVFLLLFAMISISFFFLFMFCLLNKKQSSKFVEITVSTRYRLLMAINKTNTPSRFAIFSIYFLSSSFSSLTIKTFTRFTLIYSSLFRNYNLR